MEERKHEEGKNGRQEQGNAFNASFQTMWIAKINSQRQSKQ